MRALAFVAALFASEAVAQDRMTQPICAGSLDVALGLFRIDPPDAEVTVDPEGWCAVSDAQVAVEEAQFVSIDSLRWRGSDLQRPVAEGLPPRALEIEGEGLKTRPVTGDPVFDYLFDLQIPDVVSRFAIVVRWDGVQDAVFVDEAMFEFYDDNSLAITARIDGVDLTDRGTIQASMGRAGLTAATVDVQFDGWFEQWIAIPLGSALLSRDGPPPEAQIDALKAQATDFLETMPTALLPQPSRLALATFINDLPTPRGRAQVRLDATAGIGAARGMTMMAHSGSFAEAVAAASDGVTITFQWMDGGTRP